MVDRWQPAKLDLFISLIIAVFFPLLAQILYQAIGALIPMILYYSLAWTISKWRRGSTGYFTKPNLNNLPAFFINIGIILASLLFAYLAQIEAENSTRIGIILTAIIWVPLNASSEQLLWIYIFESWDLYLQESSQIQKKWIFRGIGILLFSGYVGLIHTFFWVSFLLTVNSSSIFGILFVLLTTVSGYMHIIVWRQMKNMLFTFIPHFILNLFPLFWTGYSMLPYLFKL